MKKSEIKNNLTILTTEFNQLKAQYFADGFIDTIEQKQLEELLVRIERLMPLVEQQLAQEQQELGMKSNGNDANQQEKLKSNESPNNVAPNGGGIPGRTSMFYDGKAGAKYSITLHIKQPGEGADRNKIDLLPEVDTGHAFVTFCKTNVGSDTPIVSSIGFYPESIRNDSNYVSDEEITREVTHDQFFAALEYAYQNEANWYNLLFYQCARFALGVFEAAGQSVNISFLDQLVPVPGSIAEAVRRILTVHLVHEADWGAIDQKGSWQVQESVVEDRQDGTNLATITSDYSGSTRLLDINNYHIRFEAKAHLGVGTTIYAVRIVQEPNGSPKVTVKVEPRFPSDKIDYDTFISIVMNKIAPAFTVADLQ